jgi:hypothetical protein
VCVGKETKKHIEFFFLLLKKPIRAKRKRGRKIFPSSSSRAAQKVKNTTLKTYACN